MSTGATTPELAEAEAKVIPKYTQVFGDQARKLDSNSNDQPSHSNQKGKEEKTQDHSSGTESGPLQGTNRHPLEANHRKRGSNDIHTTPEERQPKPEPGAKGDGQESKVISYTRKPAC